MHTSSKRVDLAGWTRIAALAASALFGLGCGPAPYAQGPLDPAPHEWERGPAVVVMIDQGQAVPLPAAEPEDRWVPQDPPRPNPFERTRTWIGDYDCAQGTTGLALRILDVRGRVVRAIFDFHHAPSGAKGSYVVSGIWDGSTRRVMFEPGAWIAQPEDYVSVGMEGEVSRDGTFFAGRMNHPSCGGFRLERSR